jgi:hypothetical protein
MKNYLSIVLTIMLLAIISCQPKPQTEAVDKEAVKKEIAAVIDKVYSFFDNHEIEPYAALLSDDGLFTGTDKTEFWNKESLLKVQKEMLVIPDFKFTFMLTKRVIRVADDGKSALVIDQIENTPVFGPDMPVRLTSLIIKTENGWKIDYLGWGLIPDNEDIATIAAILAE